MNVCVCLCVCVTSAGDTGGHAGDSRGRSLLRSSEGHSIHNPVWVRG